MAFNYFLRPFDRNYHDPSYQYLTQGLDSLPYKFIAPPKDDYKPKPQSEIEKPKPPPIIDPLPYRIYPNCYFCECDFTVLQPTFCPNCIKIICKYCQDKWFLKLRICDYCLHELCVNCRRQIYTCCSRSVKLKDYPIVLKNEHHFDNCKCLYCANY